MDGLTVGRVVHYVLSESDVKQIDMLRKAAGEIPPSERVPGVQYHFGNGVEVGKHVAMVIVEVWGAEGLVNGKVLLDGLDVFWATSRSYSDAKEPSTWHWIEKA